MEDPAEGALQLPPTPPLLALEDVPAAAELPVLLPPPRKRQRVGRLPEAAAPEVEIDDSHLFTPEAVTGTCRCEARTWAGGYGGQCNKKKVLEGLFCKMHSGEGGPTHGSVSGPIPLSKLKAFRTHLTYLRCLP